MCKKEVQDHIRDGVYGMGYTRPAQGRSKRNEATANGVADEEKATHHVARGLQVEGETKH
jgi:hypothetical protein